MKCSNEVKVSILDPSYTNPIYFGPEYAPIDEHELNLGLIFAFFSLLFGYDSKNVSRKTFSSNFKKLEEIRIKVSVSSLDA